MKYLTFLASQSNDIDVCKSMLSALYNEVQPSYSIVSELAKQITEPLYAPMLSLEDALLLMPHVDMNLLISRMNSQVLNELIEEIGLDSIPEFKPTPRELAYIWRFFPHADDEASIFIRKCLSFIS